MQSTLLITGLIISTMMLAQTLAQGYNPTQFGGWHHGICSCDPIVSTKPGLYCASAFARLGRQSSTCSETECKNDCQSDDDCAGEFEVCCCGDCGNRCEPAIAEPLPPATA